MVTLIPRLVLRVPCRDSCHHISVGSSLRPEPVDLSGGLAGGGHAIWSDEIGGGGIRRAIGMVRGHPVRRHSCLWRDFLLTGYRVGVED